MVNVPERYRRLPGVLRGFISGASVWQGSDHLLLVKSTRFHEEYKRFHLRDIQAIVVASAPRFEISTRSAALAVAWLVAFFVFRNRASWAPSVMAILAVGLMGAWLYVSAARSCVCRLYTAVSRDDLPSVYRVWMARRFLEAVEPLIGQAQGVIEGNWAEAVESRPVGPVQASVRTASGEPLAAKRPPARWRTPVSDIFVASLFADGLLNIFTLNSLTRALQWTWYGLAAVEIVTAVMIFVQYHRGLLRAGMQRLAIATLVVMGVAYYARAAMSGMISASNQLFPELLSPSATPGYMLARQVDAVVTLALGCVGAFMAMWGSEE